MKPVANSYTVRFSTRGRVTIPAALRRKLGITGGSRVAFAVTPTGFVLTPIGAKRRKSVTCEGRPGGRYDV